MNEPCTQAEIKTYVEFASLSLDERRRRLYAKFAIDVPDSPLTKAYLLGMIRMPKKRGRKKGYVVKKKQKATSTTPNCPQRLLNQMR